MTHSFRRSSRALLAASLAAATTLGAGLSLPAHAQAPAAATAPAGAQTASDRKWVEDTAASGLAEVAMGKLGQERGQAEAVRQYGARMVQDHSKSNDELMKLAGGARHAAARSVAQGA